MLLFHIYFFKEVTQHPKLTLNPLNNSHIVLIPNKGASLPYEFKPINLINGVQRLLQILATRLHPHLQAILYKSQTRFLRGHNILHGFHYAHKVIQVATQQEKQLAIFKIYITKTFDSVDWIFLKHYLKAKGFSPTWIQ